MHSPNIQNAINESAERLSEGLVERLKHLAEKEQKVRFQANWETLPNMPARLLWEALEPEAGAFFVVYKLMHEMRSELPKVFRAIAWNFCRIQPERFGFVTYREQVWSILASLEYWEEDLRAEISQIEIKEFVGSQLEQRIKKDWWSFRDEDFKRDSAWIAEYLEKDNNLINGFRSMRAFQTGEKTTFTAGNIILQIPQALMSFAENVVSQGSKGHLPPLEEINERIALLAEKTILDESLPIATNKSIPLDLLAFDSKDNLIVFCLARIKASDAEIKELRRRLIFLRYFAHYAFGERSVNKVKVQVAFYADQKDRFASWLPITKPLFHYEELCSFNDFWNYITGTERGKTIIEAVVNKAAESLKGFHLSTKLRDFVSPKEQIHQPVVKNTEISQGNLFFDDLFH